MNSLPWNIVAVIVSAFAALVGALIVFNLQTIKKNLCEFSSRIDRHDEDFKKINEKISTCKVDCDRNNVSKEDWVRSEGYTRRQIDGVTALLNRMDGKFDITQKIPEVVGSVVREVLKANGGSGGSHDRTN